MRLIDADELLKPVGCYNPIKYTHEYGEVVKVEDITQMPTVEAEPIRHGHWNKENEEDTLYCFCVYKCSLCGGMALSEVHLFNYCPYCGAKMDEVDNNGEMDKT